MPIKNCAIKNYAKLAAPLTELPKNTATWRMGGAEPWSIEQLNAALRESDAVSFPNPRNDCRIFIKASEFALGANLNPTDEARTHAAHYLHYQKVHPCREKLPHHEREFLALLTALKKRRHSMHGSRIVAHTDNVALRHWKTAPNLSPSWYAGSTT